MRVHSWFQQVTTGLVTRLAVIGIALFLALSSGVVNAQVISADTSDRAGFSVKMEAINQSCRPPAVEVKQDNFTYRLVMALGTECIGENLTFFNAAKYVSLVGVTAGSFVVQAHPATAVLAATTVSELKSDGAKCVVRALIETSDEGTEWKAKWKARAMAGFSVYDWSEFTKEAPSLAEGGKLRAIGGALRDGFGAWERGTELGDFAGMVAGAVQEGEDAINTYIYGETDTVLGHVQRQREACDYRAARASLDKAFLTAKEECKAYAYEYSYWDAKLTSYTAGHYATRNNWDQARDIVNNKIDDYRRVTQNTADDLKKFSAAFEQIEDLGSELENDEKDVQKEQDRYEQQLGRTRKALDTPAACYAIGDLRSTLQNLSGECHSQFLRRLRSDGISLPEDVESEMANAARLRINDWWDRLDEINQLYRDCNVEQGAVKASSLRSDVLRNPVQVRAGDTCGPVEQPYLMAALDGLKKPSYCEDTTVPNDVLGVPLSKAYEILEEAKLYVAGDMVRVEPQEGQVPNTVIASDPAPGKTVRVWTGVKLTVVKSAPVVELVEMPEVIGIEGEKAADLVRSVGLSAAVVAKAAADEPENKPGFVYAATASEKAELPIGTMVTLSTYGERPLIEVPSVAKRLPTDAKDVLNGAGFVAIEPTLGKPAPTADDVGMVYSSSPATPEMHPMFTPVSPLIYGPVKVTLIPVPKMQGMTLEVALGAIGAHGDHFVYGGKTLSENRPENSVLGTVDYSSPGAGDPVPAGTSIVLHFYPPVGDEIGNARIIPSAILGMPEDQAAGMLRGEDDFFVVPKAKDGDSVQGDQVPGTVQYSVPATGSVALRDSAVQLYTYADPPISEDETSVAETDTDAPEQTGDDSSWIGTWKLSAETEKNGKMVRSEARAIISQRPGGILLKVQSLKDGAYNKGMELNMVVDSRNVLRFDPKILREMDEAAAKAPTSNGILKEPMTELAETLRQIFETLELSRDGTTCTYQVVDPKKGKISSVFNCIKQ